MEFNKNICQLCQLNSVEIDADKLNDDENRSILSQLFGNEIVEEIHLNTSAICFECWNIIKQFHGLYERAQTQFNNYKNLITAQQLVKEEPITPSSSSYYCKVENVYIPKEIITNDDSDNGEGNNDDNNDIDYDCSNALDGTSSIRSSISSKPSSPQLATKLVSSPPPSSPPQPRSSTLKRKRIKKNKVKKTITAVKRKTKEEVNAENEQIKEYFKMTCDICANNCLFETIIDARKHYRKHHKQCGHISCCNRKFFNRMRILEHIKTAHIKSKSFRCEKCDKNFADKFAFTNHMENHAPLDQRQFKCDICKSSFTKLYKLTQHMQATHIAFSQKKSFSCGECKKLFVTKLKLNTHIRVVHERVYAQICEICARIFKSKTALDAHLIEHTNIEQPKVQCTVCGSWLKNELGLRKHLERHTDGLQVCLICNKEAPNKYALNNHMRYVHSERKHKCSICEKAFKQPVGLREHMASHTGQDLYTCTYCPRTFKSGANMHSHRKKVHPVEWINDRQKK